MISGNHTFFFVPVKVVNITSWKKAVEEMQYQNKKGRTVYVWNKVKNILPVHLMKYVDDGVGYGSGRQFAYELNEKRTYGLPYTDKKEKILSTTIHRNEKIIRIEFDILHIRIHMFGTGIGFLVYDIGYDDSVNYADILEFNYQFKKIGMNKFLIDNCSIELGKGESFLLELSKNIATCNNSVEAEIFFSAISNVKMQANVFSILQLDDAKNIDDKLFHLSRAYNLDYEYSDCDENEGITTYHPYSYIHWGYCEQGLACIYDNSCNFTRNGFAGNLNNDYYFMYLLLLHQRYLLLDLMDKTLICKNNIEEWKRVQTDLLDFEIEYSFNVISDERTYHKIYSDMRSILSIVELENDINDVSNRMYVMKHDEELKNINRIHEQEEISADIRSRRTDIVLALLSLLAIFSALVDSTDVINEWCSKDGKITLLWPHFFSYGIICIVTLIVIGFLIQSYIQYRRVIKKIYINEVRGYGIKENRRIK